MKRKEGLSLPAVGGSSLLAVFAVLCLTVFALLSLSTVQAQKRLSDAALSAVEDYYAADLKAEEIFTRLRNQETVPGVTGSEGVFAYSCPISESQTLFVELEKTGEGWKVLRWQAVAHPETIKENLPVWNGE